MHSVSEAITADYAFKVMLDLFSSSLFLESPTKDVFLYSFNLLQNAPVLFICRSGCILRTFLALQATYTAVLSTDVLI